MSVRAMITTWVFAVLLSVLAALAWRGGETAADIVLRTAVLDQAFDVETIDRLVVERFAADDGSDAPAPEDLVFELGPEGWRQTSPFEIVVEGFPIRKVLIAAADLTASRRTPVAGLDGRDGPDLAGIGLDPPEAVVRFRSPDGERRIQLGARTVAGRSWIRVDDDDEVLVVGDDLHGRVLDDDPRNWRSRRLFSSDREIDGIVIRNGDAAIALERAGRRWVLTAPVASRGDAATVDGLVGILGRVEHDGFIRDGDFDRSRFGLDPAVAEIEVSRDDGTTERLLIGGPSGLVSRDRFAMVDGIPMVVRLDEATLRGLLPSVATLIEPTGSGVRPADVKSIEITAGEEFIRLERNLDRWSVEFVEDGERASGETSTELVDALMTTLVETRATEVAVQAFPQTLLVATVVFNGFDGRPLDAVRIAREGPGGRWAFENGDGVLRILPASADLPLAIESWPRFDP